MVVEEGFELLSNATTSRRSHPKSDQRELHFVFFWRLDRFLESLERSGYFLVSISKKPVLQGTYPVSTLVIWKFLMNLAKHCGFSLEENSRS